MAGIPAFSQRPRGVETKLKPGRGGLFFREGKKHMDETVKYGQKCSIARVFACFAKQNTGKPSPVRRLVNLE